MNNASDEEVAQQCAECWLNEVGFIASSFHIGGGWYVTNSHAFLLEDLREGEIYFVRPNHNGEEEEIRGKHCPAIAFLCAGENTPDFLLVNLGEPSMRGEKDIKYTYGLLDVTLNEQPKSVVVFHYVFGLEEKKPSFERSSGEGKVENKILTHNAPTSPGSSGSPVFQNGKLWGVSVGGVPDKDINFAIPIDVLTGPFRGFLPYVADLRMPCDVQEWDKKLKDNLKKNMQQISNSEDVSCGLVYSSADGEVDEGKLIESKGDRTKLYAWRVCDPFGIPASKSFIKKRLERMNNKEARALRDWKKVGILSGVHKGGFGGQDRKPDFTPHITVCNGNSAYHLQMDKGCTKFIRITK